MLERRDWLPSGTVVAAESDGPLRVFFLIAERTTFVPPRPAGWSLVVWARSGALSVHAGGRAIVLAGTTAMWLPPATPFVVEIGARADLRIAYVAPGFAPSRPAGTVVASALLREIVERAVIAGYLDPHDPPHARLLAVMADELAALRTARDPFAVRLPQSAPLRAIAERALSAPDEVPPLADLAATLGLSLRTFERRFLAETAETPRSWFRRVRLRAGFFALASGANATEAALASGYASLSAFVAAYRTVAGVTPGRALRTADR